MEYTQNYHLPQWAEDDRILMPDFNAAMAAIESGLTGAQGTMEALATSIGAGGKTCRIAFGSYVGNGQYGHESVANRLTPGFCPVLAVVGSAQGATATSWPTILVRDCPAGKGEIAYNHKLSVTWTDNSVSWFCTNHAEGQNNAENRTYHYCVIGYDKTAE